MGNKLFLKSILHPKTKVKYFKNAFITPCFPLKDLTDEPQLPMYIVQLCTFFKQLNTSVCSGVDHFSMTSDGFKNISVQLVDFDHGLTSVR